MNIEYEDNSDFAEFNTPRIYLEDAMKVDLPL